MRRALAAVALLAIACGGLFYNQGNGFPCDFNAAEEVRDKACAPTEVCSVLNRCERFVYEGPQFEGTPQLPSFDAGRKVHPLVLDRPVTAVTANASARDEFVVVLAADGGTARSVSVQLGRLVLLKDTPLKTAGLREVAVGGEGFGATLNATQFPALLDGTMIASPAKTLRSGADMLGLLRPRPANNPVTAGTLDSAGNLTALRPTAEDGGFQSVIDFRWLPPSRKLAPPFGGSILFTREGFFVVTDAGTLALTPDQDATSIGLPPLLLEPQPANVYLRHDLSGALWSLARPTKVTFAPTVLSTWELSRLGETPTSMKRAWNDCTPCPSNARIVAIAPNLDDLANVEVLCGNTIASDNGTLVRVVGALSADSSDRCVTQPVIPAFDLSRQTLHAEGVSRGIVIDDANGGGVVVGGQRGEVWFGPSFSRALPLYLERVPLAVGAFSPSPTVQVPFVVTDRYVAAPIFGLGSDGGGLNNGFKVFDFKLIADFVLDDDVRLRALVGGSPGWGVLSSADVARVRVRQEVDGGLQGSGNFFELSFGPRLLTARGDPAREPFFGEAVTYPDGGVISLVLTADDSLYLAPSPVESAAPNAQQGLFPQLTPEPGSPIRSFALERTRLGTDGVSRVRGYAVTSRNLFTVTLSGEPARWNATPLLLGGGEPLEVWMDNPRGGLARVGYRDGNVFSLPGGFQLVRPTPGQEPRQILDYENLGGWPVAYATSGLWVGHYDLINGKLDNKLSDGRPGKPMQWRPVTMRDGSTPWMNGTTARPGKLHVLAGPPSRTTPYQQNFRLFLYLDDAVYEVGSMLRTNASAPPN